MPLKTLPTYSRVALATVAVVGALCAAQAGESFGEWRKAFMQTNKESGTQKLPTEKDSELVLSSAVLDGGTISGYPTADKALASACAGLKAGLCGEQVKAAKIYSAAARSMGIPAVALICLTKQESGFAPNRTSKTGAKGLTQVMPETARSLQSAMKQGYTKEWDEFRKLGGTSRAPSAFTASAMRSGSLNDADVQIFETALHFRYFARDMESTLQEKFGSKNKHSVKSVLHYFFASYNAGAGRAKRACQAADVNVSHLPKETQGYIKAIDSCINKASGGRAG